MSGPEHLVAPTPEDAARLAAGLVAEALRAAVAARGTARAAFSGGRTPALMLAELRAAELPWARVTVFQVDERDAPSGHPDRNATGLVAALADRAPLPRFWLLPIGHGTIEPGEVAEYEHALGDLDVVHLGLGPDGHTASLVPGDPVLEVRDRDVALTGEYQGRRRLTLTAPAINRAGRIVWLVSGADKRAALAELLAGSSAIPAGLIRRSAAIVVSDAAAAGT